MSPRCQPAAPAAVRLGPVTMAVGITRVLTLLSVLQYALRVGDQSDTATQELLQQREEQQRQEMTWLMEQMEHRSQELCVLIPEGVIPAVCQHWWFWASAETLLLLLELYWLCRRRSADGDSGSQRGSSNGAEEKREEDGWEGKAEPSHTLGQDEPQDNVGTSAASASPSQELLSDGAASSLGMGQRLPTPEHPQEQHPQPPAALPLRPPLGHILHQSWALGGSASKALLHPCGAPDEECAVLPPLPRDELNTSRVPASHAASASAHSCDAPRAWRRRRDLPYVKIQ
ncbi:uncharacterized protein LOC141948426 [Strix uralensis]|uniref:uncharacterized protein LOC141948426 n=1 Tax=Strix uralensis TaxID=36305 RepID=UPI003DA5925E